MGRRSRFVCPHDVTEHLRTDVGFGQLLAMPGPMERDEAQRNSFIEHIVDGGRHLRR
jgi:hypothetical protein